MFAFISCFCAVGQAEGQTAPATPIFGGLLAAPYYATAQLGSLSLVSGDFNHDGLQDLAELDSAGNIEVFLSDGKGGFKAPLISTPQLNTGFLPSLGKIVAADVNGDGYHDLVIGVYGLSSNTVLFVALNQKDGTFAKTTAVPVPLSDLYSFSFTVGPTTKSGFSDIVVVVPEGSPAGASSFEETTFLNDGAGSFTNSVSTTYPVGDRSVLGSPQQYFGDTAVLADANHDGIPDLIVLRFGYYSAVMYVDVLIGNGDGTFVVPSPNGAVSIATTNGPGPANMSVADLTGNASKQDIVVANVNGVSVALSNGDGTYQPLTAQVSFPLPVGVKTADLNGDGKPDLIVAGDSGQSIYLGNGDGTFSSLAGAYVSSRLYLYSLGYDALSPVVADFNGDGIPDFASADTVNSGIEVALGNGDGTFHATPLLTSTQNPALVTGSIATSLVADLNGDGHDDIVAGDYSVDIPHTQQIITGIADGKGGFKYQLALSASYPVSFVEPIRADFNGDGKQDVVIAGSDGSAAVALSNGDGTLATPVAVMLNKTLACPLGSGAAGDLNGDKKLDLVLPYAGDFACNKGSTVPSGYFVALGNGDGTFAAASFVAYGNYLQRLALAPFHGSAVPLDMVVGAGDGYKAYTEVSLLTGNGDGTFGSASAINSDEIVGQMLTNDFNQDGKADLTLTGLAQPTASGTAGAVVWYPGNGDGTFGAPIVFDPNGIAYGSVYADLNGDGIPDLTVSGDAGMAVLLGTGGGSFATPVQYFNPAYASPVLAGNFLGDNTQSILAFAGDSGSGGTAFFKNLGGTSLAAVPSATSITVGTSLSLTAALNATLAGRPAPTGTLTFLDGTTSLGNASVGSGVSTYSLAVGSHSITVAYSGDANFNPNTSAPVVVTVAAPPPDFTLAPSSSTITVSQGQSGTLTLSVTPNASLSGNVTFSCSGLPSQATCAFSPATLSVSAGQSGTATLTVATAAASSAAQKAEERGMGVVGILFAACVIGVLPKRRKTWLGVLVVFSLGAMAGLGGCGGGGNSQTPPPANPGTPTGNSTVTVTATAVSGSVSVTHQSTFVLTVQ